MMVTFRGDSAVNCRTKKSKKFLKSSTSYQAKGVSTTPKRKFDPDAPYQGISGASRITGLAQGYIRGLCKSGAAPCLRVGQEYKINMALFLQQLEAEAAANMKSEVRL